MASNDRFELYINNDLKTLADRISGGEVNSKQIVDEISQIVYGGLKEYCESPTKFAQCKLGWKKMDISMLSDAGICVLSEGVDGLIINPADPHLQTIEFFRLLLSGDELACNGNDPLSPRVGAYLFGKPGVGKTHIMAAYGILVKQILDRRLEGIMKGVLSQLSHFLIQFEHKRLSTPVDEQALNTLEINPENLNIGDMRDALSDSLAQKASDPNVDFEVRKDPRKVFEQNVENLIRKVKNFPIQPTDVLYLGFSALCELYHSEGRTNTREVLERAKIVFIDDIDPTVDNDSLEVVKTLIERRYELGRFGTFVTTNFTAAELGEKNSRLQERLLSRTQEAYIQIDFSGCVDWRSEVLAKRNTLVAGRVIENAKAEVKKDLSPATEV